MKCPLLGKLLKLMRKIKFCKNKIFHLKTSFFFISNTFLYFRYMNIVLSDAAVFDTDGECQYFPVLHVQARNIRNVHIPDNVS